jgi:putative hydrolase
VREPAQDLRAIAFRLERALEPTYRVKAFRTAAAVVDGLSRTELEQRDKAGTLGELKGVGKVTALVISESLAGEEPNYLRRVEDLGETPVDEATAALRAQLRGDCHSHSDCCDGKSTTSSRKVTVHRCQHPNSHSSSLYSATRSRGTPRVRRRGRVS